YCFFLNPSSILERSKSSGRKHVGRKKRRIQDCFECIERWAYLIRGRMFGCSKKNFEQCLELFIGKKTIRGFHQYIWSHSRKISRDGSCIIRFRSGSISCC